MRRKLPSVWGVIATTSVLWTAVPLAVAQPASPDRAQPSPRAGGDRSPAVAAEIWDANHDGVYTCDEWIHPAERQQRPTEVRTTHADLYASCRTRGVLDEFFSAAPIISIKLGCILLEGGDAHAVTLDYLHDARAAGL